MVVGQRKQGWIVMYKNLGGDDVDWWLYEKK